MRRPSLRPAGHPRNAGATEVGSPKEPASENASVPDDEVRLPLRIVLQVLLFPEDEGMVGMERPFDPSINRNRYHLSKFRV